MSRQGSWVAAMAVSVAVRVIGPVGSRIGSTVILTVTAFRQIVATRPEGSGGHPIERLGSNAGTARVKTSARFQQRASQAHSHERPRVLADRHLQDRGSIIERPIPGSGRSASGRIAAGPNQQGALQEIATQQRWQGHPVLEAADRRAPNPLGGFRDAFWTRNSAKRPLVTPINQH